MDYGQVQIEYWNKKKFMIQERLHIVSGNCINKDDINVDQMTLMETLTELQQVSVPIK